MSNRLSDNLYFGVKVGSYGCISPKVKASIWNGSFRLETCEAKDNLSNVPPGVTARIDVSVGTGNVSVNPTLVGIFTEGVGRGCLSMFKR